MTENPNPPFYCAQCQKWFVQNPAMKNTSCTVDHGGMCCHFPHFAIAAPLLRESEPTRPVNVKPLTPQPPELTVEQSVALAELTLDSYSDDIAEHASAASDLAVCIRALIKHLRSRSVASVSSDSTPDATDRAVWGVSIKAAWALIEEQKGELADCLDSLELYRSEVDKTSTALSKGPYISDFASISEHARVYVNILNRLPLCENCRGSGTINSGEDADTCPDCKGSGLREAVPCKPQAKCKHGGPLTACAVCMTDRDNGLSASVSTTTPPDVRVVARQLDALADSARRIQDLSDGHDIEVECDRVYQEIRARVKDLLRSSSLSETTPRKVDWTDVSPAVVMDWLQNRGYYAAYQMGEVGVCDYDGEEGITFASAELADRFIAEVPGADDVGAEASQRAVMEWLKANDPENFALFSTTEAEDKVAP